MNHRERRASSPLPFVSCTELREVFCKRAMDEQRLPELTEEVPVESIYYHTHSYYLRHSYTQSLFPNDFATWVHSMLRIDWSAERPANEQECEFLKRTMQAMCKASRTIMDVDGPAATINVK